MDYGTLRIGICVLGFLGGVATVCATVLYSAGNANAANLTNIAIAAVGAVAGLIPGPSAPRQ